MDILNIIIITNHIIIVHDFLLVVSCKKSGPISHANVTSCLTENVIRNKNFLLFQSNANQN